MRLGQLALGVFVVLCVRPQPRPAAPTAPVDATADALPIDPLATARAWLLDCPETARFEYLCQGLYTDEGLTCAVCRGGDRCLDVAHRVYCAHEGHCVGDVLCTIETDRYHIAHKIEPLPPAPPHP